MSTMTLKQALPTFTSLLERRKEARKNQLPKHLRPLPKSPVLIQLALNSGILMTMFWLMTSQDEFENEAHPAIGLVFCFLLLIYTLISAFQLKQRYELPLHLQKAAAQTGIKGLARLSKINFWLMVCAFLTWAAGIVYFLP